MTYVLGKRSKANLEGLHPDMKAVVERAIQLTTQDFTVIEGVRTLERQRELYAQGRTKPGQVVTWTLKSRHLPGPDGLGRAVDIVPYPLDWNTVSKFEAIADAMYQAAKELDVHIRWGADWNENGTPRERGENDSPHFELGGSWK